MSIESALESYPKSSSLKSGLALSLRPLATTDYKAFSAFFKSLPGEDLLFLKERISDPKVIRAWCKKIDPGHRLYLLAFAEKKLVGLASLSQDLGGWKRHIGRLNVHTLPEYRGKGIGRLLINEMIEIARQAGLMWLEAEFFDNQEAAIKLFGLLGFSNVMRLTDYVKDQHSVMHDYILMGMRLITEEEYAGMG
jgi:ribosomal protein S18 acetylase RimI-like enzyme